MKQDVQIPASKSISNRLLILQYLYPNIRVHNLSIAKGHCYTCKKHWKDLRKNSNSPVNLNVGHAGTSMRFLIALVSIEGQNVLVTWDRGPGETGNCLQRGPPVKKSIWGRKPPFGKIIRGGWTFAFTQRNQGLSLPFWLKGTRI